MQKCYNFIISFYLVVILFVRICILRLTHLDLVPQVHLGTSGSSFVAISTSVQFSLSSSVFHMSDIT